MHTVVFLLYYYKRFPEKSQRFPDNYLKNKVKVLTWKSGICPLAVGVPQISPSADLTKRSKKSRHISGVPAIHLKKAYCYKERKYHEMCYMLLLIA